METYKEIAKEARKKVLDLIYRAQVSHIGSNFSAIDIMTVLFEKADPKKDEVILSAGWKAAAWYYFLWKKGIITEEELNSFCKTMKCFECEGNGVIEKMFIDKDLNRINRPSEFPRCSKCGGLGQVWSPFIGLVEPMGRWGLKVGTGSMGFGFPFAVGFALAKKLKGKEGKVYVLMSDGEMDCGTTWESALIAAHYDLDNLLVIVDCNKLQAMGKTNDILNIEPLEKKWESFGWYADQLDGHDYYEIRDGIDNMNDFIGKPKIFIANTIKGKGWKRAENNNLYHYKNLSEEEYNEALKELK